MLAAYYRLAATYLSQQNYTHQFTFNKISLLWVNYTVQYTFF